MSDRVKVLMEKAGLLNYQATPEEDICLVKWWINLRANKEYKILFGDIGIRNFFQSIYPPAIFLYSIKDVDVLTFACWFEPVGNGASITYWIAKDKRSSKSSVLKLCNSYLIGFNTWPVLITATPNKNHLKRLIEMGHISVGNIPHLDKNNGTLTYITLKSFEGGTLYKGGIKT